MNLWCAIYSATGTFTAGSTYTLAYASTLVYLTQVKVQSIYFVRAARLQV